MGYNKQDFIRIRSEFSVKYRKAQEMADARCEQLYEKIPELRVVDHHLAATAARIMEVAIHPDGNTEERIAAIREQNQQLRRDRAALLEAYGYPADYTDVHYECELCGDTGYVDTKMCACMKRALILAAYESSGIGSLMRTQTFDSFSLDYYRSSPEQYEAMGRMLEALKKFACEFDSNTYKNLLFMGGTGLGKTHLSTAIAKEVIDRGNDVLYVSAGGMLADFETRRFGNSSVEGDTGNTERYYTADLLIIDDLGTEITNAFVSSQLFACLNERQLRKNATIISTNLSLEELRDRYSDRVFSRITSNYELCKLTGPDIRMLKKRSANSLNS